MNQLKQFGSYGIGNNQSNVPLGLCCHGDYLYICDHSNRRIQILTLDFECVSTIKLDDPNPFRVQISETTIGVASNEATFCFDLKSRTLKYNHNYMEHLILIILIQHFMVQIINKRNVISLIQMEILNE